VGLVVWARWWTEETVAVVTGGNKGIGLEIVRQLAQEGLTVVLAARDEGRGLKATQELQADGLKNVRFRQLDISNPASITSFVAWIKQTFGGLDILVRPISPISHNSQPLGCNVMQNPLLSTIP
jgi:carbonyl reductase 1